VFYANLRKLVQELPGAGTNKDVRIPKWLFEQLLRGSLMNARFDEKWYLATYPDVAAAVKTGSVLSAREHFANAGYFEGRFPYEIKVDEAYYLRKNADVNRAVRERKVKSAKEHWAGTGVHEGRDPSEDFSLFAK
jgi:hypothetical protein